MAPLFDEEGGAADKSARVCSVLAQGYPTPACTAENTAAMKTGVYKSGEGWAPKGTFPPTDWQTSTGRVPCSPLYPPQATPLAVSPPPSASGSVAAAVEPMPVAAEEPADEGRRVSESERPSVDGQE